MSCLSRRMLQAVLRECEKIVTSYWPNTLLAQIFSPALIFLLWFRNAFQDAHFLLHTDSVSPLQPVLPLSIERHLLAGLLVVTRVLFSSAHPVNNQPTTLNSIGFNRLVATKLFWLVKTDNRSSLVFMAKYLGHYLLALLGKSRECCLVGPLFRLTRVVRIFVLGEIHFLSAS